MLHGPLSEFVREIAKSLELPGVAVGVLTDDQEVVACHGSAPREVHKE